MDGAPEPRVLLAVGDPERERSLSVALEARRATIAGRCLDAGSLLEAVASEDVDVAVVADTLHRLSRATLEALRARHVAVVLLGRGPIESESAELVYRAGSSEPDDIADAVLSAARVGATPSSASTGPSGVDTSTAHGTVVALTSGKGAPGKTTLASALAAAWSAHGERVVLVDADPRGGDLVACLDLDPRRGLAALSSRGSGDELLGELQDGPGFRVLAGLEPLAGRPGGGQDIVSALRLLRGHADRVVVDAGPAHGAGTLDLLREVGQVLLVSGADLVSLWNAQRAVRHLRDALGSGAGLSAVLNRREGREHYGPAEAARALGIPVAGVVREDRRATRRAVERQFPLTRVGGGAARDVRRLARDLGAPAAEAIRRHSTRARRLAWRRAPRETLGGAVGD